MDLWRDCVYIKGQMPWECERCPGSLPAQKVPVHVSAASLKPCLQSLLSNFRILDNLLNEM